MLRELGFNHHPYFRHHSRIISFVRHRISNDVSVVVENPLKHIPVNAEIEELQLGLLRLSVAECCCMLSSKPEKA